MVVWGNGEAWPLTRGRPSFSFTPGSDLHCKGPCRIHVNTLVCTFKFCPIFTSKPLSSPQLEVQVKRRPGEEVTTAQLQADWLARYLGGRSALGCGWGCTLWVMCPLSPMVFLLHEAGGSWSGTKRDPLKCGAPHRGPSCGVRW